MEFDIQETLKLLDRFETLDDVRVHNLSAGIAISRSRQTIRYLLSQLEKYEEHGTTEEDDSDLRG